MVDPKIIDTHTHLSDPVFDNDRDEVIQRAQAAGVAAILLVSENMSDVLRNLELAARYSMLLPAAGLYPDCLDVQQAEEMCLFIRNYRDKLAAIGEVGLDFWVVKSESQREIQREIFKHFIGLSREVDLPLNVHSRSAGRHVIALLLENGARKVQLHAFDGKAASALPAAEAGFFFSIPPSVLRSTQKQKLVKRLPLSSLLIETDSPVLGPSPGDRNEPANGVIVVDAIAEIKGIPKTEVLRHVYQNTLSLYGDLHI
ncbi:MAG: TatD family hydrolase [Desulfobacterales bacterium]|jgi:TatD DNase family protein